MFLQTLKIKKNLVLKKFNTNYINHKYLSWFKDKQVKKFINFQPRNIRELADDCLSRMKKKNFFLAIEIKKRHVGNIFINNIDYKKKICHLGILIGDSNFRNQGIATCVLNFLIKKIFSSAKISKIYLGVNQKNIQALRCYLKVGFRFFYKKKDDYVLICRNNITNKLILGTAQFGMPYGISNPIDKKVNIFEQKKIFNLCKRFGINEIDTAYSYNFNLSTLPKNTIWLVNTKIEIKKFSSKKRIINYLKKFKKKNILLNCVYIHDEENLFTKKGQYVLKILHELKKKKLFNKIGISIYDFNNLILITKNSKFDVIQVPFNILDKRIEKYIPILRKNNINIQARSIFLQGLLLMKIKLIPEEFSVVKEYIYEIQKNIKLHKTSLTNYLLNFIDKHNYFNQIIFGIHNCNHLKKIINYKKMPKIYFPKFNMYKAKIIDPRLWS